MFISPVQLRTVSPEVAWPAQSSHEVLHRTGKLWILFSSPRMSWVQTLSSKSSKSPISPFLVFHGLHTSAVLEFPSCKPNLQVFLCSKITTKPLTGFQKKELLLPLPTGPDSSIVISLENSWARGFLPLLFSFLYFPLTKKKQEALKSSLK